MSRFSLHDPLSELGRKATRVGPHSVSLLLEFLHMLRTLSEQFLGCVIERSHPRLTCVILRLHGKAVPARIAEPFKIESKVYSYHQPHRQTGSGYSLPVASQRQTFSATSFNFFFVSGHDGYAIVPSALTSVIVAMLL